ncbi:hypothetical protein VTO73DRAFT_9816 [Trametes versicolor]
MNTDTDGNDQVGRVDAETQDQDAASNPEQLGEHSESVLSSSLQEVAPVGSSVGTHVVNGGIINAEILPVANSVAPNLAPVVGFPAHEWSTARYPATTRQLHTMQSLSVAHNVDLPFLDDPEQQINRAGASRLIEFLMQGATPPTAVIDYILAEGVEPEPTEPFVWPNGDTELRTERQAQYIGMLYAQIGVTPPPLDNLTQNEASAMIAALRNPSEFSRVANLPNRNCQL